MSNVGEKIARNYGYDILINTFEPFLRRYLANEIFLINYGNDWKNHIPDGVKTTLSAIKGDQLPENCSMDEFFEELSFLNLKDVIVASNHFSQAKPFFGELSKDKFVESMDGLNAHRRRIAHAKSAFSEIELSDLIEYVTQLCQGESAKEIKRYLENEQYKNAKDIPLCFFEEYECPNNLPPENYDLDGGFVGREKEIRELMKRISSNEDRVITITGAGGLGKTAIALRVAVSI